MRRARAAARSTMRSSRARSNSSKSRQDLRGLFARQEYEIVDVLAVCRQRFARVTQERLILMRRGIERIDRMQFSAREKKALVALRGAARRKALHGAGIDALVELDHQD